jgi:hypothetical protein
VEIDLLVLGSFCVEGKESFCSWKKRKEEEDFSRRKRRRRRRRRRATSRFLFLEKWVLLMIKVVLCSSSWIMM